MLPQALLLHLRRKKVYIADFSLILCRASVCTFLFEVASSSPSKPITGQHHTDLSCLSLLERTFETEATVVSPKTAVREHLYQYTNTLVR